MFTFAFTKLFVTSIKLSPELQVSYLACTKRSFTMFLWLCEWLFVFGTFPKVKQLFETSTINQHQQQFCIIQRKFSRKNKIYATVQMLIQIQLTKTQQHQLYCLMTKNIFLPGGIGYIGSHVMIELLLHTDFHLTVADNFFNSSEENLEAIFECVREEILTNFNLKQVQQRVSFYEGNILDLKFLNQLFKTEEAHGRPVTSIINFAAKKSAPQSMFEPLDYYENNFVGVMNLVKMMQQHSSCTEFIFSSSAAVYGEQDDCTEEFECLPISPYGESKLCGEMLLKSIAKANPKWKIISLRYFNPAGNHPSGIMGDNPAGSIPGNLFSVIQEVIIGKRQAITVFGTDYNTFDGTGVRDFVHVVDLAKGHLKALQYIDKMSNNYEVFNFGSGNGFSVLQVIKQFEEILNQKINYKLGNRRPGDLERLVTTSEKAEKILGWKTENSLKQMCESCVKFTIRLVELQRKDKKHEL